jgi:hypothetical protein
VRPQELVQNIKEAKQMKTKHLYVCLLSLAVMLIALGVNGYRKTSATEPVLASPLQENTQESSIGPVRNLRFTLFEEGIRPAEMRINAGLVNISIEDRTVDGNGVLIQRVEAGRGIAIGNVRNLENETRGRSRFRLTPGKYELQDAARPDNKAVLVVEP